MFIRDNDRVANEINPTDPEEKQYIILYNICNYKLLISLSLYYVHLLYSLFLCDINISYNFFPCLVSTCLTSVASPSKGYLVSYSSSVNVMSGLSSNIWCNDSFYYL